MGTSSPTRPEHFDYTRAAREAALTPDQLNSLIRIFEHDHPHDLLLRELHILRVCNAINRGTVNIHDVLATPGERAA